MPYVNITNKHYDTGDYPASLARVREMIGFDVFRAGPSRDAQGRYLGIGFATYTEQSAHGTKVFAAWGLPLVPGYDQAHVKLTPDGALIMDNSEGYWGPEGTYPIMDMLRERQFLRVDFHGFAPGASLRHCTSVAFRGSTFLFDGRENPKRLDPF